MQRWHTVEDVKRRSKPAERLSSAFVHATVACVAMLFSTNLGAQSGSDTLMVVDQSGHPVPFANISIKGGIGQVTNESGVLVMHAADDTLTVLVRRLGFEAFQGRTGRASRNGAFHVTLTRSAQSLNKVVVSEAMSAEPLRRNGFYERMMDVKKGAQVGEFFTPEDLSARPVTKISDFLYASRYAHVEQSNRVCGGGSCGNKSRPRRAVLGRGGCGMTLVLDGVVVHNMLGDVRDTNGDASSAWGDDRTTIDDLIPGLDVMAVEVYPSLASAPMSMGGRVLGSACGIVAIWTGPR